MNFITDIGNFIKNLTGSDIIFFIAVISLFILIIVVIYMLRTSKFEDNDNDSDIEKIVPIRKDKKIKEDKTIALETNTDDIEMFDLESEDEEDKLPPALDEPDKLYDLKSLTEALENNTFNPEINVNAYEDEQEEKAIISYEELLEKTGSYKINYEEETNENGINVKKIDIDNIASKTEVLEIENKEETIKVDASNKLVSYEQEEAFLKALKDLQSLLS